MSLDQLVEYLNDICGRRLRGTADGQVFTGKRIDQCQPFQRAAFDRLVVDEVIAPQGMAVFGTLHPAGAAA